MDKWIELLVDSHFTKGITIACLSYEMKFQMGHAFSYLDLWYSDLKEKKNGLNQEEIITAEWEM